jgi:glycosyltransferase involved in cell wall biosynthesis
VYCDNLARQLRTTDDVRVFHTSNTTRRWRRRLVHETCDGLPVYHCIDWAEYARVADWRNTFLRRSFQSVLSEFRPEIVHVHNYISLGDDLASLAHASGARVVYTLHDFGLICPNALLLRDDGKLCGKDHAEFFQDCCPLLIRTTGSTLQTAPWRASAPSLTRWRWFSRQQPHPAVRAVFLRITDAAARWLGDPRVTDVERKRDFFLSHPRRIVGDADVFLAPSEFLLQRYVRCGLAREKIAHVRYGIRRFPPSPRAARGDGIRFGYIGALHPHKGIELLLDAFRGFGDRASLHVHGSTFGSPISQRYADRISDRLPDSVFFHGGYENHQVAAILATLDIVVVPSLWYENSPLTIQEAFAAGVPVITANTGGMAELVRHDVDGLCFRLGDVGHLRDTLARVIAEPALCDRLRRGIPPVVDIETHAAVIRDIYQRLAP